LLLTIGSNQEIISLPPVTALAGGLGGSEQNALL
jgi:hypothetical protein